MSARFSPNFWSDHCSDHCNAARLERADEPSPLQCPHLEWGRLPDVLEEDAPHDEPEALSFGRDVALFVPENYEPNYAYPLIVWLHGDGGREGELHRIMQQISTQNYFGLAFRGPVPAKSGLRGFRWLHSERAVADFLDPLYEAVCLLRGAYHIHSERIFAAGFDGGASFALQLLLARPEWFGGAIALGGRFPATKSPLARFRELGGKKVLVGAGTRGRAASVGEAARTGRLLHAAGMHITTRFYEAAHELTPEILGSINHWLMDGIYAAV